MSHAAALPPLSEDKPLPPEYWPNIDHLVTEDDEPVDNLYSEKQQRLLTESLYNSWTPGEPFLATANVGLFFGIRQPPIVPDVLVAKGVTIPHDLWPKQNRSYLVWEYGKPPDAALEIVSNQDGGESTTKKQIYARVGVTYYVIWDPENFLGDSQLQVLTLRQQAYEPLPDRWLPALGLGVTVWQGKYEAAETEWLRWCDRHGNLLLTGGERAEQEAKRAEQEAKRAEQEAKRAEHEAKRAEESTRKAEKLAAQLWALGIKPEDT